METYSRILFYSHHGKFDFMSNFYSSNFTENNITYNCSEQYFMKKKQELFDPLNIELANKILSCTNPHDIKKYGRQVKNYINDIWNEKRYEIMKQALRLKFNQNEDLKNKLKQTGNKKLYEASPYDNIWGTGFNSEITLQKILENKENELGQNLLGLALEEIRSDLQ